MKNKKSIITNSISILLGVLIFIFLSQSYFSFSANMATSPISETKTGYQLINDLFVGGEGNVASIIMVFSLFLMAILAGVMIALSIYNLLVNTGVIKETVGANKIIKLINMIIAVVIALLGIAVISSTASYLSNVLDLSIANNALSSLQAMGMQNVTDEFILENLLTNFQTSIGFGNIINLVFGILVGGVMVYDFISSKKN